MATRSFRHARGLTALLALSACVDQRLPTSAPDAPETESRPAVSEVWLTTPDQSRLLERQPDVRLADGAGAHSAAIVVDATHRYQQMTGFGAAVTGSSAWLIRHGLSAGRRDALMRTLFDPRDGIGLNFVRTSIGASDFSLRAFTYNDLPTGQTDPGLERFSIEPDRESVLPVLKHARRLNPALRVIASPWSAPAWMKTSARLNGGSLRTESYATYAQYFRRFVQAYRDEGIAVYAVTVQNEPRHEADYPSMRMEPREQAAFVRDHLGPTFVQHGISTRILGWDHNWDDVDFPLSVLNDAGAKRYLAGTAFHCYAGDVANQSRVREAAPDKDIYFTECSGGGWSTDFGANLAWNVRNLIIGATRNWGKSVVLWNLALDPRNGPTNGGCRDCRGVVTVDPARDDVNLNVEFYVLGHASKFVAPGAFRIASDAADGADVSNVAFQNPDGSRVLIALNSAREERTITVREAGRSFEYTLPAGAVATFRWQ